MGLIKVLAIDYMGFALGKVNLRTHDEDECMLPDKCCVHNPSDHHMRDWPLMWRADTRQMERIDPKTGIGHPDPDDLDFKRVFLGEDEAKAYAVHGCDGVCSA